MGNSLAPVKFFGVSMVTTTLGVNDGSIGDTCEDAGTRYLLVYNDGGASASAGYGMVLNSGATGYSVTVSSTTSADLLIGVVKNATFTTGCYGWLATRGFTQIQMIAASSTVLTRAPIILGANGLFAPNSQSTGSLGPVCGQALSTIITGASGAGFISVY